MAKILGLAKLQRKLDRMPTAAKAAIKAAMEKGAEEIVANPDVRRLYLGEAFTL
mgnify:CR=1 FL=1